MKNRKLTYLLTVSLFVLMAINSCKKDETSTPLVSNPIVTTLDINGITSISANSGGKIIFDGGSKVNVHGVCWSIDTMPTISSYRSIDGTGAGTFTSAITGLSHGITYYVRAYATNSSGTGYGSQKSFFTTLKIGDNYQGGIIADLDSTGMHGLIIAPLDQSSGIQWYNGSNTSTGATDNKGNKNTNTIVASQGDGTYAAKLCYDLVLGGYDDWFLPSYGELITIYNNRDKLNIEASNSSYYWSSTEHDISNAYYIYFYNFNRGPFDKANVISVRATRYF